MLHDAHGAAAFCEGGIVNPCITKRVMSVGVHDPSIFFFVAVNTLSAYSRRPVRRAIPCNEPIAMSRLIQLGG
jgi:hypothetical protein